MNNKEQTLDAVYFCPGLGSQIAISKAVKTVSRTILGFGCVSLGVRAPERLLRRWGPVQGGITPSLRPSLGSLGV